MKKESNVMLKFVNHLSDIFAEASPKIGRKDIVCSSRIDNVSNPVCSRTEGNNVDHKQAPLREEGMEKPKRLARVIYDSWMEAHVNWDVVQEIGSFVKDEIKYKVFVGPTSHLPVGIIVWHEGHDNAYCYTDSSINLMLEKRPNGPIAEAAGMWNQYHIELIDELARKND